MKIIGLGIVLLLASLLSADSSKAVIKISPNLSNGLTKTFYVCSDKSTKVDHTGISPYDKCITEYGFGKALDSYFKQKIDHFVSESDGVIMKSPAQSAGKSDYLLFCSFNIILDVIQNSAIYYFQLDCEIHNIETHTVEELVEKKRKFKRNRRLSDKELIEEGKDFLDKSFPDASEYEKAIQESINYHEAALKYRYNDPEKKEANGKEKGILTISNIIKKIEWAKDKPRNLTEFTLSAKQGKFTETQSNEITFTPFDYMKNHNKLEYEYQTYDCNQKGISDKAFETFILKRTSQLSQKDSVVLAKLKVPFECSKPYYTLTATKRTIRRVKPLENYRGMEKELKSYEEDKEVYYIYVDIDRGKIDQYHVDEKSSRKIHKEAYELNMKRCQYEVVTKDKLVKNLGGSPLLKSEDSGWGFEDDSRIYVDLPEYGKKVSFRWGSLREQGHYHTKVKYKKQIPAFVKDMMGRVNDMATLYRNETKHSKEIEYFKDLYDYPGTPREVQCGGKVAMESLLIPPLDGWQDPEVTFQLDIRPSSKSEIEVMKKYRGIK